MNEQINPSPELVNKIINLMGDTPKRTRRKYYIGRAAAAVLLFALATVTVLAVAFPELWRSGEFYIFESDINGIEIRTELGHYPFIKKVREYIRQNEGEPDGTKIMKYSVTFDSFEEASDFFGVTFAKLNIKYELPINGIIYYIIEEDAAYIYLNATAKLDVGNNSLYHLYFSINDYPTQPFHITQLLGDVKNAEKYIGQTNSIEAMINKSIVILSLNDVYYGLWTDYENTEELNAIFKNIVDAIQ